MPVKSKPDSFLLLGGKNENQTICVHFYVLALAVAGCGDGPEAEKQAQTNDQSPLSQEGWVHNFRMKLPGNGNYADVMGKKLAGKFSAWTKGQGDSESLLSYARDTLDSYQTIVYSMEDLQAPKELNPDAADMCRQMQQQFIWSYTKTAKGIEFIIHEVETGSDGQRDQLIANWREAKQHMSNAEHCYQNAIKKARKLQ